MATTYADGGACPSPCIRPQDAVVSWITEVVLAGGVLCFVGTVAVLVCVLCSRKCRETAATAGGARRQPAAAAVEAGEAAAAVVVVEVDREGPLVCTYRREDGWPEAECGVCLAEPADGEAVRVLPACMHYFHAACAGEWLRRHPTCPLCRAPVAGTA
ncbi:hypothetical protein ACP70R_008454 [Stipagrostis hirtigluma subsp. patula]